MGKLKLVTYCGLYCGLCAQRGRIPQRAEALRQAMTGEGYELWGVEIPGFNEFWKFLGNLCDPDKSCPGCRQDGGYPLCSIRKCARKKKVDTCPFCDQYPCRRIKALAKGYPTLIPDGQRLKKIGVDAWLKEQKQRAQTGFQYTDIRCQPYEIPE
jgi:hypothetical protein